jgi:hypothetical protein
MTLHYRNETLFSEIYLEEITRQPEEDHILASLRVLREYRDYADVSSLAAWTQSYIHEVFAALGFNHKPKHADLTLLFPMGGTDQPLSLCYVTLPDESLDNTTLGRNWAEKLIRALHEEGFQWGLLTNGKSWRIYHVDEATPYETYLEIDLERILAEQAKDAYQIFHKFMKAENFVADEAGKCQFDRFKKESKDKIDYIEKELANALKQREENGKGVLSDLCMGYVDELRQLGGFDLDDEVLRRKIYHGSMLYMFRLLFLFYADARGLLSDENHDLLASVEADARALHKNAQDGAASYAIWERLAAIFVDIDQTYNGGLFSPQESEFTQFIEETRIADPYLAGTLFNLTTYREKNGEERPISYRDMSVRHLGTLYEGLLEHKLFITQEATEVRVTKGKIEFIPASQGGKLVQGRFLPEGAVYFGSDPSERKSTGSYYTPEYIVDYITRNTVGEKLKEIKDAFLKQEKGNLSAYANAVNEDERMALASLLEENALTFVREKILTLSVLDPAMGSGHFLVNVTNLISNFITEFLNEMGMVGTADTSPAYWRRWVVENCIYGVDLNPLAVELAKLSLWLLSMAKDQPLSFTNHHLKCGNSLVGARLEEIGNYPFSKNVKEPRQLNMFEKDANFRAAVEDALAKSRLIASHASTTLEDVEEKKAWLAEIENDLDEYKAICDLHTSLYFDSEVSEEEYLDIVDTRSFAKAKDLANINYFHWELEFPEVFFGQGGFVCIVSNPPYDTFKENGYFKKGIAGGTGNLFGHFIVKAIDVNSIKGDMGFVIPLSFSCGSSYEETRKEVFRSYGKMAASHYSIRPSKLFPGVDQRITIFIAENKNFKGFCELRSSRLWRWKSGDEEKVVNYPDLGLVGKVSSGLIPKTAGEIGARVYSKILGSPDFVHSLLGDSNVTPGYYHSVARYWVKAYDFVPHFIREGEAAPTRSTKLKELSFVSPAERDVFVLLINSSLFYYWWIAQGDEFDVMSSEVLKFKFDKTKLLNLGISRISELVKDLMADYHKNSVVKSAVAGGKKIKYQEFYPRNSLRIINQIDDFLAPIYGLSEEENLFVKTYDLTWRTDEE